jgi:hypothetical protein
MERLFSLILVLITTGQPAAAVRDRTEGGGLHPPDVPGPTRRHSCRHACISGTHKLSVADPERFFPDQDPSFHVVPDPDSTTKI